MNYISLDGIRRTERVAHRGTHYVRAEALEAALAYIDNLEADVAMIEKITGTKRADFGKAPQPLLFTEEEEEEETLRQRTMPENWVERARQRAKSGILPGNPPGFWRVLFNAIFGK